MEMLPQRSLHLVNTEFHAEKTAILGCQEQ